VFEVKDCVHFLLLLLFIINVAGSAVLPAISKQPASRSLDRDLNLLLSYLCHQIVIITSTYSVYALLTHCSATRKMHSSRRQFYTIQT